MRLQFVRVSAVNGRARGRFILASSLATLVLAGSAGQALADVSGSIGTTSSMALRSTKVSLEMLPCS
jgi:hypothetical protein